MRLLLMIALVCSAFADRAIAQSSAHAQVASPLAKYSMKNHAKAKNVDLEIGYPRGWKREEGTRPNIVQKFSTVSGKWYSLAMVITKDMGPEPISDAELKEFYGPAGLRDITPAGGTAIGASSTKIEGLRAGIFEYRVRLERAGATMDQQTITYAFITGRTMVLFQGSVGALAPIPSTELDRKMEAMKPVFQRMANSIVLPALWR